MNTLILGGSGIIGNHLKKYFSKSSNYDSHEFIYADSKMINLLDIYSIKSYFLNRVPFNNIIFLVGLAHSKGKKKEIEDFNRLNYLSLKNTLETLSSIQKIPQKLIFGSTISIYGERYDQKKYKEDTSREPFSPYALTKLYAENYLISYYKKISYILRFAPVYSKSFDLNIIRRTKINFFFYKVGDGGQKLSLCHAGNIFLVIESILKNVLPKGIYNISDVDEYNYNDLLDYKNAKKFLIIPRILISLTYLLSRIIDNTFLRENCIKLLSDNVYCSKKIQKYVKLEYTLKQ